MLKGTNVDTEITVLGAGEVTGGKKQSEGTETFGCKVSWEAISCLILVNAF